MHCMLYISKTNYIHTFWDQILTHWHKIQTKDSQWVFVKYHTVLDIYHAIAVPVYSTLITHFVDNDDDCAI